VLFGSVGQRVEWCVGLFQSRLAVSARAVTHISRAPTPHRSPSFGPPFPSCSRTLSVRTSTASVRRLTRRFASATSPRNRCADCARARATEWGSRSRGCGRGSRGAMMEIIAAGAAFLLRRCRRELGAGAHTFAPFPSRPPSTPLYDLLPSPPYPRLSATTARKSRTAARRSSSSSPSSSLVRSARPS
jgi:hypothetical protein